MALLGAGCGDDPAESSGFETPEPVPRQEPTALRLSEGPPAAELARQTHDYWWPTYHLAALGTEEVVAGAFDGLQPGAFFVGSVSDGGWEAIDPPVVPGEMESELVTVGHDAVLVGAPCSGDLNPESDELAECPDGYLGLGVWRLDHRTREWSEVALVPLEDLDLSGSNTGIEPDERWWWSVIGVVDDAVAVSVSDRTSRVVTVDMDGNSDIPYRWTYGDGRAQVTCMTGSGALVGVGGDGEGMSGTGTELVNPGLNHLAVHRPGQTAWTVFDDVTFTDLQSVGCGGDQISIVGETDATLAVAEWHVVDPAGQTLATTPLPDEAVLGHADFTSASFFARDHQHISGTGRNRLSVVRDFGDVDQIDQADISEEPGAPYPVLLPRRVAVLAGPGAPALIQEFPGDQEVIVERTTTMPDGRIVALVHRRTDWEAGDDTFQLLIAE